MCTDIAPERKEHFHEGHTQALLRFSTLKLYLSNQLGAECTYEWGISSQCKSALVGSILVLWAGKSQPCRVDARGSGGCVTVAKQEKQVIFVILFISIRKGLSYIYT